MHDLIYQQKKHAHLFVKKTIFSFNSSVLIRETDEVADLFTSDRMHHI